MFLLLKSYVLDLSKKNILICIIASVLFAFVPFHEDYGLSSAGIPMIAYAFTNLFKSIRYKLSYFIIVIFGACSSLVLSGWIICLILFFLIIIYLIKIHKFPFAPFIGLILLSVIYIINKIGTIINFINPVFISHRVEFQSSMTFVKAINNTFEILKSSQPHAGSFRPYLIIFPYLLMWFIYRKDKQISQYGVIFILVILLVLIGYSLGISSNPIFHSFQFSRAYFLIPSICFILFAISLSKLFEHNSICLKIIGVTFSCIILISTINYDSELKSNMGRLFGHQSKKICFHDFYDETLFNTIKRKLAYNTKSDKVVCLGFYPSIAEYNGFYTLDGYFYNYPLDYKKQWESIIHYELDKSSIIHDYFCYWGSRCYIFSSELDNYNYIYTRQSDAKIRDLNIDIDNLKLMGCDYILSAVEIANYEKLNLTYIDTFCKENSIWKIRVYQL